MSWITDRQTTIYSRVDAILTSKLGDKYEDLNVTMDNTLSQEAMFPTVFINFIGFRERGETLDGTSLNGGVMDIEVHIKTSNDQGMIVNQEVADCALDAFKTMGFKVRSQNIPLGNIDGVYESVSRFTRTIGQGDVI